MGQSAQKKVLLIENDQDLRSGVCDLLESEGYLTESATCCEDAILQLKLPNPPAVIILDCVPPYKNGFEFFRELEKLGSEFSEIPVLLMFTDSNICKEFPHKGVIEYIKKPLDLDVFLTTIEKSINITNNSHPSNIRKLPHL